VAGPIRRGQATCAAGPVVLRARTVVSASSASPRAREAGARYAGAAAVYGLHSNSCWWCVDHYRASQSSTSKGEVGVLDPIPPSALPADRFCAVCARLLVNQRGGSENEQVADVCWEVMCAHCAGEKTNSLFRVESCAM